MLIFHAFATCVGFFVTKLFRVTTCTTVGAVVRGVIAILVTVTKKSVVFAVCGTSTFNGRDAGVALTQLTISAVVFIKALGACSADADP